jgi:hypothetical protein
VELTVRQIIRPFWLIGAFLMMMDGLTTYFALSGTEGAREGNPIMAAVMGAIGLALTCGLKGVIGILMVYRLAVISERGHRYEWMNRSVFLRKQSLTKVRKHAAYALAFTVLIMGMVVGNNLNVVLGGAA